MTNKQCMLLKELRDNPCLSPEGNADIAREVLELEPRSWDITGKEEELKEANTTILTTIDIFKDVAIREVYKKWKSYESLKFAQDIQGLCCYDDMCKAITKYCEEDK